MNQAIEQKDWNHFVTAAFRFIAVYLFLYALTRHQHYIYNGNILEAPIIWAGKLLITPDYTIAAYPGGSGDTMYNYLEVFCIFVSSFLLAIIWWILDRRRRNYDRLLYWLMVVLRYTLASVLITYGSIKIFKLQFPFPSALKLDASVGDLTPMGLAWVFMGYSTGYNLCMGLAEALAGFLLFFRRTRIHCLRCLQILLAGTNCSSTPEGMPASKA